MQEKSQKYIANTTPTAKAVCPDANRKVKGTIHWVSCAPLPASRSTPLRPSVESGKSARRTGSHPRRKELRCADSHEGNDKSGFTESTANCYIEKFAASMRPLSYLQFQRIGYFNVDKDSTPEKMVVQPYSRLERYLGENQQITKPLGLSFINGGGAKGK